MERLFIALDRGSVRRKDEDGHLHVGHSNFSKSQLRPYLGKEIPRAKEMGLDPEKVYTLYCLPEELEAAASTFAGKPLLLHHEPVTTDDHPQHLVIGSVGTEVRYNHPYLRAPLTIWRKDAIDAIESGEQAELSAGYRYRADMTPNTLRGVPYDGKMKDIRGNHVAIVKAGRAGSDVVVADAALTNSFDPKILGLSHVIRRS